MSFLLRAVTVAIVACAAVVALDPVPLRVRDQLPNPCPAKTTEEVCVATWDYAWTMCQWCEDAAKCISPATGKC
jgi:hypothetical protein